MQRFLPHHHGGFFRIGKVWRLPRQLMPSVRDQAASLAPVRNAQELGRGKHMIIDRAMRNSELSADLL